jgi:hypothetical protein
MTRWIIKRAMLSRLSKRFRLKAALALAALYAFCILAPHVALAVTHVAAHCLTAPHGAAHVHSAKATKHVHADGTAHEHHGAGAPDEHSGADGKLHATCCGVFCVSALAQEAPALAAPPAVRQAEPGALYLLIGHEPDRINRPPIG